MKLHHILICLLSLVIVGCNAKKAKPEKGDERTSYEVKIKGLSGRVTVAQVKGLFNDVKQGHGPYLWSAQEDNKEIWFWIDYSPPEKAERGITATDDTIYIGAMSLVSADNPDDQKFIWPSEYKGLSAQEAMAKLYPSNK